VKVYRIDRKPTNCVKPLDLPLLALDRTVAVE